MRRPRARRSGDLQSVTSVFSRGCQGTALPAARFAQAAYYMHPRPKVKGKYRCACILSANLLRSPHPALRLPSTVNPQLAHLQLDASLNPCFLLLASLRN
jgi:hypothetical protein